MISLRTKFWNVSRSLKKNQSCGYDGILNEFLKTSSKLLIAVTMLFNIVLQTGKIPHAWYIGYNSPIYKGKGKVNDPDTVLENSLLVW